MMAKRSPPMPTFIGSIKLSTAAVATAASIALPPLRKISRPAWAASGWLVLTMPFRPTTSDRLWASQPSALSPRTALQAGGLAAPELHVDVESCWDVAADPANAERPSPKSNILERPCIACPPGFDYGTIEADGNPPGNMGPIAAECCVISVF